MIKEYTFDSSPDASKDTSITMVASMSKHISEAPKEVSKDISLTLKASMSKLRPILIASATNN